jgi:D-ribose pyranase
MAQEFLDQNEADVQAALAKGPAGLLVTYKPHTEFKKRVPQAIGLIPTADTIHYANMILTSVYDSQSFLDWIGATPPANGE